MFNIFKLFEKGKPACAGKPIETPQDFYDELAADTLARTIWGEARNESDTGMEAVAMVVLNRVAHAQKAGGKYWWGAFLNPFRIWIEKCSRRFAIELRQFLSVRFCRRHRTKR